MALPLLIGTCRLSDLLVGPKGALLCLTNAPDTLRDSAPVGSTAPRPNVITIDNCGGGELKWDADIKSSSPWVAVQPDSGTVGVGPPVNVIFKPSGLDSTGMYRDVAVVNSPAVSAAQELPLSFKVYPCKDEGITIGDTVIYRLTDAECGAPHGPGPGRYAKIYSFQGSANDSVSIEVLGTAGFDAYVALDSSKLATIPPLAAQDDCLGTAGDPCIYYYRLPKSNTTYYVEVTSADSADSGTFKMRLVHKRKPNLPTALDQRLTDSVTGVLIGGTVNATSLLLKALASDPDLGDSLHLDAEVRPASEQFSGPNVPPGPKVANGQLAWISTGPLVDKTPYHWRVRVGDNTGQFGDWDSLPGDVDFQVNVPHSPNVPTLLGQAKGDGTPLGAGATSDTDVVVLSATVADSDPGDQLRLVVEVRPVTDSFTSPTDSSAPVVNGGRLQVTVGPLANSTDYHWRARALDQLGDSSAWVSFGAPPETNTDFRISVAHTPFAPESLAQFQSDNITPLPVGGATPTGIAILKGKVSDPDAGQLVQLDVEVKPLGTDFVDTANFSSSPVANGATASVTVSGLAANTCYHWQARAQDVTVRPGAWASFPQTATNQENEADFCVQQPPTELFYTVQPAASTTAGVTMSPPIKVAARDINHNVVTSFTDTVTISIDPANNPGGGTLSGTLKVAAVAGVATFSDLSINKKGAGYKLRAEVDAPSLAQPSTSFTITAAATSQLVFTTNPPPSSQAGANMNAVVTAEDQFGNQTSFGGTVLVTIANNGGNPTPGNLTGGGPVTASNGVAPFPNLQIDKTGSNYTLQAASPSQPSLKQDTSTAFNITHAPPTHLVYSVQPSTTAAGSAITPTIRVEARDQFENLATSFTNNVQLAITSGTGPPGANLTGGGPLAAVGGVASFPQASLDKISPPNYTLTASAAGLANAVSSSFAIINSQVNRDSSTVVANPASITASNGSSTATITVTAKDGSGNVVPGAGVTLAISGSNNTPTPASLTQTTNGSGVAQWTLSSTKAEAKVISAVIDGVAIVQTDTVTVVHATPSKLVFTVQPAPNTTAGVAINPSVVVTAQDQFNNTATSFGSTVSMAIVAGPPGGAFAPTSTNFATALQGVATFPSLRIYKSGSGYQIQASGGTLTATPSSNAFTINTAPAHHLKFTTQPTNTAVLARIDSAVGGVVVTVQDSVDNTVSFGGTVRVIMGNPGTNPGGGTLNGGTAIPAPSGIAVFQFLTITAPGTGYTLQTTSSSPALIPDESDPFAITTGPAAKLAITTAPSSTAQSGVAFAQQPVIQVQDANGFPVSQAGLIVTATIATGTGASLSNATASTNASGAASFSGLTLTGLVGNFTLRFSSGSLTPVTSGNIVLSAGPAAKLAITTPPSGAAQSGVAFAQQPVIQLQDASGNSVSQGGIVVTTTVATGPGGATLTNATATTNPSGAATFSGLAINGLVGNYTLRFGATGLSPVTTGTIALSAGQASKLVITTPPSSTAQNGTAFAQQPVIQIEDANGNHVNQSGTLVTASIATGPGSASLTNATATTNASGTATFSGLAITGPANSYTLAFAATGLTPDTSGTITLTAGPPTKLAITTAPSSSAQSGVAFAQQPVIQLQDASGNPVSQNGVLVTATIASGPGSATLNNATATTNSSGAATFSGLAITGPANSYTLAFGATGLASATSGTIALSAGSATKLGITTQPSSSAQSGTAFAQQPVIQLQDVGGNPVSQSGVLVTATIATNPGGSPSLSNATATTNASGAATFSGLAINGLVGNYTLTFSATSLTSITSGSIALSAGGATKLAITTTPSNSAQSGVVFGQQPVIQLQDAGGNPVNQSGTLVTATIATNPGGSPSLTNATATTTGSGAATFSGLAINGLVGNYTLTFSATSLTSITSGTIALSAGPANKLTITTQPSSNAQSGVAFSQQPVIQIRDASGNPVSQSGTLVTTTIATNPGGTPSLTNATATTNASGAATYSGLAINGLVGSYTLSFGATSLTPITSGAINLSAGAASKLAFTTQPTTTTAGATINPVGGVKVTVQDAAGNTVTAQRPFITVDFGNNAGGGTLSGTLTVRTGMGTGIATFSDLSINKTGTAYTLTATTTGLTDAISAGFDINPAAPDHLVFTVQPSNTQAGQNITPAVLVEIRDVFENLVTNATDNVSLVIGTDPSGGLGTLTGGDPRPAVGGVATFATLSIDILGIGNGYTLVAGASGMTGATSNTFDITP